MPIPPMELEKRMAGIWAFAESLHCKTGEVGYGLQEYKMKQRLDKR